MFVEPILDTLPAVKGVGRGRPRRRPVKLHADKAYDNRRVAATCAVAASPPASRGSAIDHGDRLGRHRWVVERTVSWLLAFRRLALRYDRTEATITALATLAITVICARRLTPTDY
jgi:transposase